MQHNDRGCHAALPPMLQIVYLHKPSGVLFGGAALLAVAAWYAGMQPASLQAPAQPAQASHFHVHRWQPK